MFAHRWQTAYHRPQRLHTDFLCNGSRATTVGFAALGGVGRSCPDVVQRVSEWLAAGKAGAAAMTDADVTHFLERLEAGDAAAESDLMPLVYDKLRRLAARELRKEPAGHTLQPTALVHEAWLQLVRSEAAPTWRHQGHFFAAAAQAMRRILVDHARRKQTFKRSGGRLRVPLESDDAVVSTRRPDLLALDDALSRLSEHRPDVAELVALRYFAGLTMKQAAAALGISPRTADRNWTYARAWLLSDLSDEPTE